MKVKRIIAIILITTIAYTGLASFVAWLIIRNDRKNSQANNPTNIESVITDNSAMEIVENQRVFFLS
jgi:Flp pilus assembly protein CpaB